MAATEKKPTPPVVTINDEHDIGAGWVCIGNVPTAYLSRLMGMKQLEHVTKTAVWNRQPEFRYFRCLQWPARACPIEYRTQRLICEVDAHRVAKRGRHVGCTYAEETEQQQPQRQELQAVQQQQQVRGPTIANNAGETIIINGREYRHTGSLNTQEELDAAKQLHWLVRKYPRLFICRRHQRQGCRYRVHLLDGRAPGSPVLGFPLLMYARGQHNHPIDGVDYPLAQPAIANNVATTLFNHGKEYRFARMLHNQAELDAVKNQCLAISTFGEKKCPRLLRCIKDSSKRCRYRIVLWDGHEAREDLRFPLRMYESCEKHNHPI